MGRFAVFHGKILSQSSQVSDNVFRTEVIRITSILMSQISRLDLQKIKIPVIVRVEHVFQDPNLNLKLQRFSDHLYDIEDAIWTGEISLPDFSVPLASSDLFDFL
jgi:hypothetical protein